MADFEKTKQRIKEILQHHRGRSNPISRPMLVTMIGLEDRLVRELIAEIRQAEKIPIIGALEKPAGYFLATCPEEIDYGIDKSFSYLASFRKDIDALREAKIKLFGSQDNLWDFSKRKLAEAKGIMK